MKVKVYRNLRPTKVKAALGDKPIFSVKGPSGRVDRAEITLIDPVFRECKR